MRLSFAALVAAHGLIHLIGVVHHCKLAALPQMTGRTLFALPESWARGLGAAWLVAAVALMAAAAALALRSQLFGPLALGSVLLSQALIIHAWPDAKFGTVINVALLAVAMLALAAGRFERETSRRVGAMLESVPATASAPVTQADLAPLPPPVRRWLTRAGVVGKPRVRSLRLEQSGRMRTALDGAWMAARATQWFVAEPPGFVWHANIRMKGLPVLGRDSYLGGHGRMLITLGGLVPIVDAADARIDQGTLLRFLGELIWFPSAALSSKVHWEPRDEHSALARMSHGGVEGQALWTFDAEGRFVSLRAQRYMGSGQKATLEDWYSTVHEYRRFDGIEVPAAGEVSWQLKAGELTYYKWRIDAIEYRY